MGGAKLKRALILCALLWPLISPADDMLADEWAAGIGQLDQVRDGLVAYWSMRDTGGQIINEVGATTLNMGETTTTATSNGIVGAGASFGTIAATATGLCSSAAIPLQSPMSISLWFMFGGDVDRANVLGTYDGTRGIFLDQQPSIAQGLRFESSGFATNFSCPIRLPVTTPSNYHHVVISSDGTSIAAYVNGILTTNVAGSMPAHTNLIYMGHRPDSTTGNDPFGKREELRIYDRALSASDAVQLHHMGEYLRGTK